MQHFSREDSTTSHDSTAANAASSTAPLTISAITTHIVSLFEQDALLRDLWVIGEVSTWKPAASGHVYFSLKDSGAAINAVMWRNSAAAHTWLPKAGDQILAHGYAGVYPERGAYQLYVNRILPAGRGQLYAQFEALKQKLAAAGLFDAERKRPFALSHGRIGIVTSADAAALRDILRVLAQRWPLIDVIVFPTLVQGAEAPAQIELAIQTANRYSQHREPLDLLIVTRGGGSIEDLWAFNDERVAYAIAHSELPVVSGVGHETDFTIADFVADLRTPTPSAAAAAVTPDQAEVLERLANLRAQMMRTMSRRIGYEREQLAQQNSRSQRLHPTRQLDRRRQQLDDLARRLHNRVGAKAAHERERIELQTQRLEALNPQSVLQRGYSIVQRQNGAVVHGPDEVAPGDELQVRAIRGAYRVQVSGT
ncbi:MAG: exodeoxyribonuclease VII large subunit [Caldilineaceae bacterium]